MFSTKLPPLATVGFTTNMLTGQGLPPQAVEAAAVRLVMRAGVGRDAVGRAARLAEEQLAGQCRIGRVADGGLENRHGLLPG